MAMEQRVILLISGTAHELGGLRFLLFRTFRCDAKLAVTLDVHSREDRAQASEDSSLFLASRRAAPIVKDVFVRGLS